MVVGVIFSSGRSQLRKPKVFAGSLATGIVPDTEYEPAPCWAPRADPQLCPLHHRTQEGGWPASLSFLGNGKAKDPTLSAFPLSPLSALFLGPQRLEEACEIPSGSSSFEQNQFGWFLFRFFLRVKLFWKESFGEADRVELRHKWHQVLEMFLFKHLSWIFNFFKILIDLDWHTNSQLWPVAFARAQVEITSWDNTIKTQSKLLLALFPFLRNSSPSREHLAVFLCRGILETEICGEVLQLRASYLSGIDESLLFLEGRRRGEYCRFSFICHIRWLTSLCDIPHCCFLHRATLRSPAFFSFQLKVPQRQI